MGVNLRYHLLDLYLDSEEIYPSPLPPLQPWDRSVPFGKNIDTGCTPHLLAVARTLGREDDAVPHPLSRIVPLKRGHQHDHTRDSWGRNNRDIPPRCPVLVQPSMILSHALVRRSPDSQIRLHLNMYLPYSRNPKLRSNRRIVITSNKSPTFPRAPSFFHAVYSGTNIQSESLCFDCGGKGQTSLNGLCSEIWID